jgi:hypothetical protein
VVSAQAIKLDSVDAARSVTLKVTLPNPTGTRPDRQVVRWGYNAGGPGAMDTIDATRRDSVFLYASQTAAWIIWACRDATRAGVVQSRCTQISHAAQPGIAPRASRSVLASPPDPVIRPAPGAARYPHQPAGYHRIAESAFSATLPRGWSAAGQFAGCWYNFSELAVAALDPSAPASPPHVLKYTWPRGLPAGTSAEKFGGWDKCGDGNGTEYSQVYESAWFKLEGSSFEAPGSGMKLLGFWGVGEGRDWNKVANQIFTMTPGGTFSRFTLHWMQQNQVSRRMPPNVNGDPLIVVGQWTRYEVLMTLNDIGAANGTLKVWINGQLTHDYRDVVYRTANAPSGFYERRWDPTWGGAGPPPAKTKDDVMLVDHVYISGMPSHGSME